MICNLSLCMIIRVFIISHGLIKRATHHLFTLLCSTQFPPSHITATLASHFPVALKGECHLIVGLGQKGSRTACQMIKELLKNGSKKLFLSLICNSHSMIYVKSLVLTPKLEFGGWWLIHPLLSSLKRDKTTITPSTCPTFTARSPGLHVELPRSGQKL